MLGKGLKAYSKAPNKGRKGRLSREREISLLMLDLNTDKLYDSGKEDEGNTFHILQVLGLNEDLWDKVLHRFMLLKTQ